LELEVQWLDGWSDHNGLGWSDGAGGWGIDNLDRSLGLDSGGNWAGLLHVLGNWGSLHVLHGWGSGLHVLNRWSGSQGLDGGSLDWSGHGVDLWGDGAGSVDGDWHGSVRGQLSVQQQWSDLLSQNVGVRTGLAVEHQVELASRSHGGKGEECEHEELHD